MTETRSASARHQSKGVTCGSFDLPCEAPGNGGLGPVIVLPALLIPSSTWWRELEKFGFALADTCTGDGYVDQLFDWDEDFLLPRELAPEVAYLLHGVPAAELFEQCGGP